MRSNLPLSFVHKVSTTVKASDLMDVYLALPVNMYQHTGLISFKMVSL